MYSGRRWRMVVPSLIVILVTSGLLFPLVAEAATRSLPLQNFQTWKGFVAAKIEQSMMVLESSSTIQVVVTEKTQVVGHRTSFAKIAIDDVVRVEGSMTADRRLLANRIDVLLAADGMRMGHRAKTGPLNSLISVIMNGGVTIPLQ